MEWNTLLSGYAMQHIFSCQQMAYVRNIYRNECSTSKLLYTYVYALLRNKDINGLFSMVCCIMPPPITNENEIKK